MPFLLEILIPLFAFLSGNLFNRWWNRGMPLLVLQGFSTFVDETTTVKYTHELKKTVDNSWIYLSTRVGEGIAVAELHSTYVDAKYNESLYEKSAEKADEWIQSLEEIISCLDSSSEISLAQTHEKTKNIIREIYDDDGMRSALDLSLTFGELHVEFEDLPKTLDDLPNNLSVSDDVKFVSESNPSLPLAFFQILWSRDVSYIGKGYTQFTPLRNRFLSLAIALKSLDPNKLRKIIKDLQPILEKEVRLLKHIHEYIDPILDENKRWSAKIRLENYGSSPIIIEEKAYLLIGNRKENPAFPPIQCELIPEDGEGKIKGKYILGTGKKVVFWVATKKAGSNESGENENFTRTKLIGYFNNKKINESAFVRLTVKRIGGIKPREFIYSDPADFNGNLIYPKNCIREDIKYD